MRVQYPFPHHQCAVHQDIHISYMDEGKGDTTILFIHGLANYAPVWTHQLAELSKTNRCIAIDLPGNGYSSHGDYPYTMFFYAECVVRFIENMKLKNVVLAGHSMGGQVAIIVALRYPHLLEKLLLIAPAGLEYFAPHEVMIMKGMLNMGTLFYADEWHLESAIEQSFFKTNPESAKIITELKVLMKMKSIQQWRNMSTAGIIGMLDEQVQPYLSQIQVPTHIIFGAQDALIPNAMIHLGENPQRIAEKAATQIPNATTAIIPHAGHFVQIEKSAEVNQSILGFIADAHQVAGN
jgi:pimeloyl-ACP methyl ester carboxylesterase